MVDKQKKSKYNKTYYRKHREDVLKYSKQKVKCECGAMITRANLNHHRKTIKHRKLLTQNQRPIVNI